MTVAEGEGVTVTAQNGNQDGGTVERPARTLPERIDIPVINGEMIRLRPAAIEDLPVMDELDAWYGASGITGRRADVERAIVHDWVRTSVAWGSHDPQFVGRQDENPALKHSIAWTMERPDGQGGHHIIGMIFLVSVNGWSKSARIQVVLGKDFRGRGYSRDAMPRVLTYAFAPEPSGMGLYRVWVAVPEKNTRSLSVYRSLGFTPEGVSRKALWDEDNGKYQDLHVMGTLADEFDPIRSLDAFGMHLIEDNPGVKEALAAREHSVEIDRKSKKTDDDDMWPFNRKVTDEDEVGDTTTSKRAWWRNFGMGGKKG